MHVTNGMKLVYGFQQLVDDQVTTRPTQGLLELLTKVFQLNVKEPDGTSE